MNFTVTKADLVGALKRVDRIVERRTTVPILSNVKIETDAPSSRIKLTATDLDLYVETYIPAASITKTGATTVPSRLFSAIAGKLVDDAPISVAQDPDKGQVAVKAGKSRFSLPCLPIEDFPDLSDGEMLTFKAIAGDLLAGFQATSFAISTEETRYYLDGVYVHSRPSDGELIFVATDGHRLSRKAIPLPDGAGDMLGVIVPRKAVAEIERLLEKAGSDPVTVSVSARRIRVDVGATRFTSKLIDGTFPDYSRVIPPVAGHCVDFDTDEFIAAIDRVMTISAEKARSVRFRFSPGSCEMSIVKSDAGSSVEEVDVSTGANDFEIGINGRYALDMLDHISKVGGRTVFWMTDPRAPIRVHAENDELWVGVIMPVRV